jgi:hypothetical protein
MKIPIESLRYSESHVVAGALLHGRPFGVNAEDLKDDGNRVVLLAAMRKPLLSLEDPGQRERIRETAGHLEVDEKVAMDAFDEALAIAGGSAFVKPEQVERSAAIVRSEARRRRAAADAQAVLLEYRPDTDTVSPAKVAEVMAELAAAEKGDGKIEIPLMRSALKEAFDEATGPAKGPYGLLPSAAHATYRVAEVMDGWNGLIMVPAAPGTGKTTFALQAGLEAVEANPDSVFVFFSYELTFDEVRQRVISHMSGVTVRDIRRAAVADQRFDEARRRLDAIADRFAIVSSDMVGRIGGTTDPADAFRPLQDIVESMRRRAGVPRSFVVVDNMQQMTPVLEMPGKVLDPMEVDRYAMEGFKGLRNRLGTRDPLMVIAETRKDDFGEPDLGSVLGTGRTVYAADHIFVMAAPPWPEDEDQDDDEDRPKGGQKGRPKRKKIDPIFLDAVLVKDRPFRTAVVVNGVKVRNGRRGPHRFIFKHPENRFSVVEGKRP